MIIKNLNTIIIFVLLVTAALFESFFGEQKATTLFAVSVIAFLVSMVLSYYHIRTIRDIYIFGFFNKKPYYPKDLLGEKNVSFFYSILFLGTIFIFLISSNNILKLSSAILLVVFIPVSLAFVRYRARAKMYNKIKN